MTGKKDATFGGGDGGCKVTTLIRSALVAGLLVLAWCGSAWASERVALVIGNGAYKFATELPNPTNDATDITEKLKTLGFEVYGGNDLDLVGMQAAIRQFAENSSGAKVVLFFYAGHGMQMNEKNYLVSVNAKLESEFLLSSETMDLDTIVCDVLARHEPASRACASLAS